MRALTTSRTLIYIYIYTYSRLDAFDELGLNVYVRAAAIPACVSKNDQPVWARTETGRPDHYSTYSPTLAPTP